MCLEDLDWDDQGILQKVVENHSIEDINTAVIGATGEERVFGAEVNLADGLVVVFEVFVGCGPHVHVEPDDLLVVGAENEVVALRVDGQRGDPLGSRLELSHD